MREVKNKLIRPFESPFGKVVLALTILWYVVFFGGAFYFNSVSTILVWRWCPAVLIWYHILFFAGIGISYLYLYKLGARKGL